MALKNILPHVVVLDLKFSGYGVVRSLAPYHIPVIGLYGDRLAPESHTRLCKKKYYFSGEDQLVELLTSIPDTLDKKPVLILTMDAHVKFFLKYRQLLQQHYLIDMPCDETINLLLDKNLFSDFAGKNGIRIPPGIHINDSTNLRSISGSFRFPCILKPYLRNPDWRKAGMPKAFFVQNYHELEAACEKAFTVEPNLILQEWIPGQDHNVHYCLSFYGKPGERIASFSGMKIRQYPVDTGSTASTKAFDNEWIKQETDRIFRLVNYTGFGSVEYKKHEDDQMYYLIEPTAGRLNQQEYVSTLNGVNLPLRAYNYLTGCNIPEKMSPEQKNVVYIDELAECASTLFLFRKKRLTFREYCQSIQGPKAWRYSNFLDPGVGLGLFPKVCNMLISRHD